jgi:hypothetical protein
MNTETTKSADGSDKLDELVRPVFCPICKRQMHYAGRPDHEPELTLTVTKDFKSEDIYIHDKCWNRLWGFFVSNADASPSGAKRSGTPVVVEAVIKTRGD